MTQTMMHSEVLAGPNCNRCGAEMRLFGIESHPTIDGTDLHTFVCTQCDAVQAEIAAVGLELSTKGARYADNSPACKCGL
jgi:hypothetical protein